MKRRYLSSNVRTRAFQSDAKYLRLDLADLAELGLGFLGGDIRRDDDIVAREPVDGSGDTLLVRGLQGIHDTEHLGSVTAGRGRVGQGETDLLVGVNDEDRADGQGQTLLVHVGGVIVVQHVIQVGNLAVGVGNDGELEIRASDLVNVLDPLVVRLKAVGALQSVSSSFWIFTGFSSISLLTRPMSLTPRAVNSGSSLAKAPSSVVQMGVKSA